MHHLLDYNNPQQRDRLKNKSCEMEKRLNEIRHLRALTSIDLDRYTKLNRDPRKYPNAIFKIMECETKMDKLNTEFARINKGISDIIKGLSKWSKPVFCMCSFVTDESKILVLLRFLLTMSFMIVNFFCN